jgi:PAS domain S-box-containing protein
LRKTIVNALDHKRLESQRKLSQKALRESEKRFRDLVENSLLGISIIQNNKIVYQNPEQSELFNPLPKKLDANLLEYVHPDDTNKVKGCYQSLISGKTRSVEADFRFSPPGKKDTKVDMRWVQCRASMFKHKGNDALLVNTIDITRAKDLEQILRVKSKMLSLGRIAAGIAHEIRNPLTGINSYLYTLEDFLHTESLEPEKIKMMQKIVGRLQVASNKIESVIKRVLDFSKPGAPSMALVNINKPLIEAINLSAASLRKNNIKIKQSLEQGIPHCYADSQLIEQVILNLINNAAKALEKTEGDRIIELISASKKNNIIVRVSDSGPGVPLELRDKMFDPFFTTRQDGSGIGLSIAQRIIADHSGSIDVGSSKLGGAEFRVELPIDKRKQKR